ncbi:unnamed protein product [Chrysodeixis includens]|uniref:Uncharacterized protein n=1 Tax=Chrysodeixis includens TaxID=689277 RepID=A0A9P0FZM6_CHRIL|nr:unnamed protein product [Chrysodeixis includens]
MAWFDFDLIEHLQNDPFFEVTYDGSNTPDKFIYQREDFKERCNNAANVLQRDYLSVKRKMTNIILKYAKINLLLSKGLLTHEDFLYTASTSMYVRGHIDFLKEFVSGFTDADIPKSVNEYFNGLFKMYSENQSIAVIEKDVDSQIKIVERKHRDLDKDDEAYVKFIIKKALEADEFKNQLFGGLRLHSKIPLPRKRPLSRKKSRAVPEQTSSNTPNILRQLLSKRCKNSEENEGAKSVYGDINYNEIDGFVMPTHSIGTILPHPNIKYDIDNCGMLIDDNSNSDTIEDEPLFIRTLNDALQNVLNVFDEKETSNDPRLTTNFKTNKNYQKSTKPTIGNTSQNITAMNTSLNNIPDETNVANTEVTPELPITDVEHENSDEEFVVIEDDGVSNTRDPIAVIPNENGVVDMQTYMNCIGEILCQLPKERRKGLLYEVDQIVSSVLEGKEQPCDNCD